MAAPLCTLGLPTGLVSKDVPRAKCCGDGFRVGFVQRIDGLHCALTNENQFQAIRAEKTRDSASIERCHPQNPAVSVFSATDGTSNKASEFHGCWFA